jgi:hypothetical protein
LAKDFGDLPDWLLGIRQAGVGQARQRSVRLLGQVDPD